MTRLLTAVLALAAFAYAVADNAPVQIALEGPRVQFEPATIRLRIRIMPHASNRGLTVAAISEGFSRSSYEQLEGAAAPLTRWIEWGAIPTGEYDLIAYVFRGADPAVQDHATASVLGRGF